MADEPSSHLFIYAGQCQLGNDGNSRGVEGERKTQGFQFSRPVTGCKAMKLPRKFPAFGFQSEEERFYRRSQFGGVEFPALDLKGDLVPIEIDPRKRKAGFMKTAPLVDGNRPRNLHPIRKIGRLDNRTLFIGNRRLRCFFISAKTQLRGGVFCDVIAVYCLVENFSEGPEVMDRGVSTNLLLSLLQIILVGDSLSPIKVLVAVFTGNVGSRFDPLDLEKSHQVFPSAKIHLQGCFFLVCGSQPGGNPRRQQAIPSCSGRGVVLDKFLGSSYSTGITAILNTIPSLSGGLSMNLTIIRNPLYPPVGATGPLKKGSHSVPSVPQDIKKANRNRENKRESMIILQRFDNSWFKSMRGSSSIYQGLEASVPKSVPTISEGARQ